MRGGFLVDPDVAYLNHGSFGACAAPVFEEHRQLQRECESEPTAFSRACLARRCEPL